MIYIWDYEKCLLLGSVQLHDNDEPTCFEFINGFSILLIGTNHGEIYFLNFKIRNHACELFRLIGYINIGSCRDLEDRNLEDFNLNDT